MIDVTKEKPITLSEARKLAMFPRPPAFTTILRWYRHGFKATGVKLEGARIGNAICTSVPAITRFIERLSTNTPQNARTPSEKAVGRAAAAAYLDALGIK